MNYLNLIIYALAVFRATHFLVFDVLFTPIRNYFVTRDFDEELKAPTYTLQGGSVRRFIGKIVNCYWCTGIWASVGLWIGLHTLPKVTTAITWILAIAAIAAILETFLLKSVGIPLEMKEVKATHEEDGAGVFRGLANAVLITVAIALIGFGFHLILGGK